MMQILLISVLVQFGSSVQYEVTEEACANDLLFIWSAEECEAAANALGITWNSCCQNDGNLPYGCLKRANDVIWNGKTDTVQKFPCSVSGNCAHGMRWAVCYKGDDSVFSSEIEKNCCISGWAHDTTCKLGCPNCACLDGGRQCGCIYVSDVDQSDYFELTTTPQPTTTEFEYTSTEVFDGESYEIGWIEYSSCTEGDNPQSFNGDYSMADLIKLAESAVTVKILPSTDIPGESETADYALTADLCSNPIFALNHGFTMSYSVGSNLKVSGMADTDNWIGQNAHDLLWNKCGTTGGNTPFALADGDVYWACGNTAGLHIKSGGCWFDWKTVTGHDITVWLGFDAEGDRVCVEHDDGSYILEKEANAAHLVVQGRTSWGGWGSAPDSYCQSDDDNQAAYDSSKHSRNIGVGCCSTDGTTGYRPDCKAHPATYQEAVDLCAQNGYRLCTEHEMLFGKSNGKGITEFTGCNYDCAYQWVSDECDVETAAAAATSGSNKSGASDGEDGSFDDFIPMVLGAAAGIAVIAGIVALVVAMRKKKVTEDTVTEMSDVVHVPDASAVSVDGDEAVATR